MADNALVDNMKATAQAVVDGYGKWNMDAIMSFRAANCVHEVLPKSLGREPKGNEEYSQYFSNMIPLFKDFTVHKESEAYDPINKRMAFHFTSTATSPVGPYSNEYAFFIEVNDDGTKCTRIQEMVDSAYSGKFFGELMAHVQKCGGSSEKAWEQAYDYTAGSK